MLSPLQRQILGVVGELPEAARFALAGGAALILRGTVERGTNDPDFFIGARDMAPGAILRVVEATETALAAAGMAVTRDAMSETFARLTVAGRDEFELSAADHRQLRDEVHTWRLQIGSRRGPRRGR